MSPLKKAEDGQHISTNIKVSGAMKLNMILLILGQMHQMLMVQMALTWAGGSRMSPLKKE